MTPDACLHSVIIPALRLLPPQMDTPEARAELLAIALQETKLKTRRQVKGPAISYWQFEKGGGIYHLLKHERLSAYAQALCAALDIPLRYRDDGQLDARESARLLYEDAFSWSELLAAGFSRLLLYALPYRLAGQDDPEWGWQAYLDAWQPGKPHHETWPDNFARAWRVVLAREHLITTT